MPEKKTKTSAVPSPRKIKIKVVGLGGGGGSIVCEMAQSLTGMSFVVADTDVRPLRGKASNKVRLFHFGEKMIGGMGTGMDPVIAHKAAIEEQAKIEKIFAGQDLCILIGALGGGVASGAGPVFAEAAKNQKCITLGIFTLPFNFEGENKMKVAKRAVAKLEDNLSGMIMVPNEKIFQIIDKKTPLKQALSSLNQIFVRWVGDLLEIISRPNLINIDFADLKTILKDWGQDIYFSQAMASGPNRVEEITKKIFENPLFDSPPQFAKRILFNITGGKDLLLKEVEIISSSIAKLNPRAKIIFGISQIPEYKGKIKIMLLAVSGRGKNGHNSSHEHESVAVANNAKNRKSVSKVKKKSVSKQDNKEKTKQRRSAVEIKEQKEENNDQEWAGGEPSWEVPAFLRNKLG